MLEMSPVREEDTSSLCGVCPHSRCSEYSKLLKSNDVRNVAGEGGGYKQPVWCMSTQQMQ
jgi:hypothetical protein